MSRAGSQRVTCGLHPVVGGLWLAARVPVLPAYIFAKGVRPISLTFFGICQSDFYRERWLWRVHDSVSLGHGRGGWRQRRHSAKQPATTARAA